MRRTSIYSQLCREAIDKLDSTQILCVTEGLQVLTDKIGLRGTIGTCSILYEAHIKAGYALVIEHDLCADDNRYHVIEYGKMALHSIPYASAVAYINAWVMDFDV